MMWKKVISMLLVAAMLAMPIGWGKDGNKYKDTTSGVETDAATTAEINKFAIIINNVFKVKPFCYFL